MGNPLSHHQFTENPLADLLGVRNQPKGKRKSKYKRTNWVLLLPVALAELKREGYKELLGMCEVQRRKTLTRKEVR